MKKGTPGIFNPYKKEEVKEDATEDKQETDVVHLTGNPYSIVIKNTSLKSVPDNLGLLLKTLMSDPAIKEYLNRCGVELIPTGAEYERQTAQAILATSHGRICVYVGTKTEGLEDEVFRRLGHALYRLNRPDLYNKQNVQITKRG